MSAGIANIILSVQTEYVKNTATQDLVQQGLMPVLRPSLCNELERLSISERLAHVQVSKAVTAIASILFTALFIAGMHLQCSNQSNPLDLKYHSTACYLVGVHHSVTI